MTGVNRNVLLVQAAGWSRKRKFMNWRFDPLHDRNSRLCWSSSSSFLTVTFGAIGAGDAGLRQRDLAGGGGGGGHLGQVAHHFTLSH